MSFGYREIQLIQEEAVSLLKKLIGEDEFLKMRERSYYRLLQNDNLDKFIIHSDVFAESILNRVAKIKNLNRNTNVPAVEIFKYYLNFLQRADEIAYGTNYQEYSFALATPRDTENFITNILKPIVDRYNEKYDDAILVHFGEDSAVDILTAVIDEFETEQWTMGNLYQIDKDNYMNIINLLEEELATIELGQFYASVPGTEGVRPAFNIFTAIYESLDELPEEQLEQLASFVDEFLVLDEDARPKRYQAFLDDGSDAKTFLEYSIQRYLSDVVEQGVLYKQGKLTYDNPLLNDDQWSRGRITRGIGSKFSHTFISNKIDLDWDILLKNSPDPAGFVFALNNGIADNMLVVSAEELHMPVSYSTLEKVAEITGNNELTTNAYTENLYSEKLKNADVSDLINKYFERPIRTFQGELADDDPYITKVRRAFANWKVDNAKFVAASAEEVAEELAFIDKELEDIARGVGELDEDLTLYHSRPVRQGTLPLDGNFHAGTYEAALDRAILKYAGRPMYQLAAETFTELNDQINAELANIILEEDYITSVAAEFGTGDNVVEILAEIEWNADNEEVSIRLIMDDEYLSQYPEYNEGISLEEYGLNKTDTLEDAIGGKFEIEDHINVDSFVRDTPVGVSDEFQWADGYDLYEVKLAKGAKVLNLNVPITVEQKGKTVPLSADRLQEAVEKGLNQPGSDEVYQGVEAINIGSNRVEIPDNASAEEISDLLFGEFDAIAYTNDIEDVGSISYVIKPQVARVRRVTQNAKRLFNYRAIEQFSNTNPFLFKGGFFDADRRMRNILNQISDVERRSDVNRILEAQRAIALDTDDRMSKVDRMVMRRNHLMNLDIIDTDIPETIKRANDFYVVTPEQLSEAIDLMKDANEGEVFETHNQLISELKEWIFQDLGFDTNAEGAMGDLDTVLDDWLTNQGTFEDTKFFNNFPKIENLPDPKNIRGLVAAAGGPENIKEGYVQPQYFKDKPNVPYTTGDTPGKPATIGTPDYTDKVYTQIPQTEKEKVIKLYEDGIITPRERDKLLQGQELYPPMTGEASELEEAITKTDGIDNLNKSKEIISQNPRIFRKIFSVLEKFDVGDQVIQQVIKRALPRIGMSAATGPVAIAYAAYETSLLLADAINSFYKAETTSESFWDNFGEISDKYSIAYKITKPTYDLLLDAIKVDLEDDNTLYSFSR